MTSLTCNCVCERSTLASPDTSGSSTQQVPASWAPNFSNYQSLSSPTAVTHARALPESELLDEIKLYRRASMDWLAATKSLRSCRQSCCRHPASATHGGCVGRFHSCAPNRSLADHFRLHTRQWLPLPCKSATAAVSGTCRPVHATPPSCSNIQPRDTCTSNRAVQPAKTLLQCLACVASLDFAHSAQAAEVVSQTAQTAETITEQGPRTFSQWVLTIAAVASGVALVIVTLGVGHPRHSQSHNWFRSVLKLATGSDLCRRSARRILTRANLKSWCRTTQQDTDIVCIAKLARLRGCSGGYIASILSAVYRWPTSPLLPFWTSGKKIRNETPSNCQKKPGACRPVGTQYVLCRTSFRP